MPLTASHARGWQAHWPAVALALIAAVVALWAHLRLFPAYSWNRDEPVYLWHVEVLRSGRLTAPDGGHPDLFHPWLSARGDGVLFTQYTLGWPLVLLAARTITGTAAAALPLGAALAVVGTYAFGLEVLRDRRVATVGAAGMVLSPILAIQGGVYLSYLFTLGLGLLAGALLLSGIRLGHRWRGLLAGALLGWVFLTRPYDALLWGAAFAGCALLRERQRGRAGVTSILVVATAALPFVLLTLLYNQRVTGSLLQFPITAADPMDTFGFGPKRLMPTFEVVDYDLGTALRASAKNAVLLPWFLVGGYLGLAVALVGLWQRRREPSSIALVAVAVVFPLGYFVFWGNHLSSLAARISGPIYLIPLYAPICLLIASALVRWWSTRRRLAQALGVALVVATVPGAWSRFDVNQEISATQEPWRASVAHLDERALVVVADTAPYLLYLNPFSANAPDHDGDVLYAVDGGPELLDLLAEQPDRSAYLQQASLPSQAIGPRENPRDLAVSLIPIEVLRGEALSLAVSATRPDPTAAVHLSVRTEASERELQLLSSDPESALTPTLTFAPLGAAGAQPLGSRGSITVTMGLGRSPQAAAASPAFRATIVYRVVDGEVEALLPVALHRWGRVNGSMQWQRTLAIPELEVRLRAVPAG